MDQTHYPSVPRLNVMHAQRTAHGRRIRRLFDNTFDPVEQLFTAATAEDWAGVARAIETLAELPADAEHQALADAARAVDGGLRTDPPDAVRVKLTKLLAECRAASRRV